jgi:hypothetical protein
MNLTVLEVKGIIILMFYPDYYYRYSWSHRFHR